MATRDWRGVRGARRAQRATLANAILQLCQIQYRRGDPLYTPTIYQLIGCTLAPVMGDRRARGRCPARMAAEPRECTPERVVH